MPFQQAPSSKETCQIKRSTVFFLRLKESDLKMAVERASEVARKTERELFHLYNDTDSKYKSKYRSLMFNLRDTKNNVSQVFPSPQCLGLEPVGVPEQDALLKDAYLLIEDLNLHYENSRCNFLC